MAISKEIKLKADSLLSMGESFDRVHEITKVPIVTLRSWKKRLDATNNNDLNVVVDVDLPTLHHVAEEIKKNAPAEVVKKVDMLVKNVVGLKQLEPKFHQVVMNLLTKAETLSADEDLSIKDWLAISNGIGNLYTNIFNKSGVNVNVLNQTQVSGEKMQMFKSSMRGS